VSQSQRTPDRQMLNPGASSGPSLSSIELNDGPLSTWIRGELCPQLLSVSVAQRIG
jgi:hypothetical protein